MEANASRREARTLTGWFGSDRLKSKWWEEVLPKVAPESSSVRATRSCQEGRGEAATVGLSRLERRSSKDAST